MLHKLSLRWRLTLMSAVLISVCCIGLTIVLNYSAYQLANSIEASITTPALIPGEIRGDEIPQKMLTPSENVSQAKLIYGKESIIYSLAAVLLGSILTYYAADRALKPVRELNIKVKKLDIDDLSDRMKVPDTKDEIAELTNSFNEMNEKIHEAFSMQKRFSANAAHELRTPLTVLQTKLDVFHKKEGQNIVEYEALLSSIQKQVTRLRDLIKNLLDMTNLEIGEQQSIVVHDLFEEILYELADLVKEKKITITLNNVQESIIGNPDLLYRVFYNLVENAIKYNVAGGKVEVVILKQQSNENDQLIIFIKDSGIGIPEEAKKLIFEPFYRVESIASQDVKGTGLGLALVDIIIKKHHGCIEVNDQPAGGTCFKITFTRRK